MGHLGLPGLYELEKKPGQNRVKSLSQEEWAPIKIYEGHYPKVRADKESRFISVSQPYTQKFSHGEKL